FRHRKSEMSWKNGAVPLVSRQVDFRFEYFADLGLLNVRRFGRINFDEIVLTDHAPVFLIYFSLKDPKAFVRVLGVPHVHPRFVIFHSGAAIQDAGERNLQGDIEVESDVGIESITIKLSDPRAVTSPHGVARERS